MKCTQCEGQVKWRKIASPGLSRVGICPECRSIYAQATAPGIIWVSPAFVDDVLNERPEAESKQPVTREDVPTFVDGWDVKLACMIAESMLTEEGTDGRGLESH